jgi:glycosyltransferase involved in cell wall biosynthesis
LKILQISIEVNSGSVGRIAEQIGESVLNDGGESYITYARRHLKSSSKKIRIGTYFDVYMHLLQTRFWDNHCLGNNSKTATENLINKIKTIQPDIIHLHHLHGYFINIESLFRFLAEFNKPVVWTFHDCWSFTGHCAYFEYVNCNKWESHCFNCPQTSQYPKSIFKDRSRTNFTQKQELFCSIPIMTIVPVSFWLGDLVKRSFLQNYPVKVIQNGIDLDLFKPKNDGDVIRQKYNIHESFVIIGVASTWEERKGLQYFIELEEQLSKDSCIVLVGLTKSQIKKLPNSIYGIKRTENVDELAALYSLADVFVNPTLEDTFPTTNLEALACGTPVITFRTGGSVESVSEHTGIVVEKGDTNGLKMAIDHIKSKGKKSYTKFCRDRAERLYNKKERFLEYIELYKSLLSVKKG